jgi:hypothetical protein
LLRIDPVQDGVAIDTPKLDPQLFGDFPLERILGALPRLDVAAWEVPHVWIPSPIRGSVTQQDLVVPAQDHGYDAVHLPPPSVTPDGGKGVLTRH